MADSTFRSRSVQELLDSLKLLSTPAARDGQPVELRAADKEDCDLLYQWQQYPETRKYARNSTIPDYEEHCSWLNHCLNDERRCLIIIIHAGQPAGALRLDGIPKEEQTGKAVHNCWEVSIYLAPDKYGLGIGTGALMMARELCPHDELVAFILPENQASLSLFNKCGYFMRQENLFVNVPGSVAAKMQKNQPK